MLTPRKLKSKLDLFFRNGILYPKLFGPAVRKKCSSHRERLLKFIAKGQEFAIVLQSLEQFIKTEVRGDFNIHGTQIFFGCCFPSKINL